MVSHGVILGITALLHELGIGKRMLIAEVVKLVTLVLINASHKPCNREIIFIFKTIKTYLHLATTNRSSHPEVFLRKSVLLWIANKITYKQFSPSEVSWQSYKTCFLKT